jgi:virginiamycin B lyase
MRAIVIVLAALALSPASAAAAPAVSGEFPLPGLGTNNKIVQGPDGNMWATVGGANDVARIDVRTGAVTEFDLPEVEGASGITVAAGKLWITQNGGARGFPGVTSFSPADPVGTRDVEFIGGVTGEPSIVAGPDGNLWMAAPGFLVRIEVARTLAIATFQIPGLVPKDIDVAGSLLVVADAGATQRIVTATMTEPLQLAEHPLGGINPQGVAGAPNGQIAFSKPADQLGLLTPPGLPQLTQSPGTDPFGVALGPDGAFWFAQFVTDTVTRLTAPNQATTLSPGFAKGAGPRQIAAGPGNTLWVTLPAVGRVGRISGVENPPPPPPPSPSREPATKIEKGPKGSVRAKGRRATVKFRFSSPDAGAGFQCRLFTIAAFARQAVEPPPPRFRPCRSPKALRLKPGRYRFEVRAVLAGIVDRSPAKRSFKVVRAAASRR